MPILAALLLVVQIAFAIHAVRTNKEIFWVYIIMFVPAIGGLVYFVTQVLPELGQSRAVKSAGNSLIKAIDPQRELRRRKEQLELADTLENRVRLADECLEAKLTADAIGLYQGCLKGIHADDPHVMLKLAQAHFAAGDYGKTKETLDALIAANPRFRSPDGHLLYARVLEGLGQHDAALEEYEALARSYPGEEGRLRYALLLRKTGKTEQARQMLEEIQLRARRSPKYYQRKEREWIRLAQEHRDQA